MMRTIVWDVDDVLNDLMASWFHQVWLPAHPDCTVTYAGIRANPPHQTLGIEKAEYLASLDAFRLTGRAQCLTPNAEVLNWLRAHGANYRHVALTARPLASAGAAADWVFRHFGNYIRCYGVVPSRLDPTAPVYDRDKSEFLRWFGGADYFVDDSEENIAAVQTLGVTGFVYPQPWNRSERTVEETLRLLTEQAVTR